MKKEAPDLAKLDYDLKAATEEYEDAHRKAQAASSEETRTINNLSAAQKAIDTAINYLHGDAPWNTEWHQQQKHHRQGVET